MRILARIIRTVVGVIAALIVLGILFRVLEASRDNGIVTFIDDVAKALVGPFDGLFELDNRKATIAINWGIAAAVYLVVGAVIASLLARLSGRGPRRKKDDDGDHDGDRKRDED